MFSFQMLKCELKTLHIYNIVYFLGKFMCMKE